MHIGSFEKMIEEFRNGTYDFTKDGQCTGCGKCCSNLLPMTEDEIEVIKKYIKRYHIKEQKRLLPVSGPVRDMTCPFLNNDLPNKKCVIYEVRPKVCRDFICNPEKRLSVSMDYVCRVRMVNARVEFFLRDGYL